MKLCFAGCLGIASGALAEDGRSDCITIKAARWRYALAVEASDASAIPKSRLPRRWILRNEAGAARSARPTRPLDRNARRPLVMGSMVCRSCRLPAERIRRDQKLSDVHVPGQFRCAKCGFVLHQASINASTGGIHERDEPGEKCPNDGSPLWRMTWKDQCLESEARLGKLLADPRVQAIEAELMGFLPIETMVAAANAFASEQDLDL